MPPAGVFENKSVAGFLKCSGFHGGALVGLGPSHQGKASKKVTVDEIQMAVGGKWKPLVWRWKNPPDIE